MNNEEKFIGVMKRQFELTTMGLKVGTWDSDDGEITVTFPLPESEDAATRAIQLVSEIVGIVDDESTNN